MVWSGMEEGSRGRGKEGCALLMSERMWKGLEDCRWKGTSDGEMGSKERRGMEMREEGTRGKRGEGEARERGGGSEVRERGEGGEASVGSGRVGRGEWCGVE